MFFKKKSNKTIKCDNCSSKLSKDFEFCPYCGISLTEENPADFGLLGKDDRTNNNIVQNEFGITEKLIGSVINSLMKNLNKEIQSSNPNLNKAEIKAFPNGVKISIGQPIPIQNKPKKSEQKQRITENQLEKLYSLPKSQAKTSIKRIGNKVVYELVTPGVESIEDIFVSKLESGYEIKVIGNKKVYVNTLPINLPLRKYSIGEDKLVMEFNSK